jgi:tryptophanyl-tRNA synthetase
MSKKVILTGLSPTAENLHIGNLIGAIHPLVEMQNDKNNELYLFVSDLHALTNPNLKLNIANSKKNLIATYIASGIDPSKTILFYQSDVHTHAELG